MQVLDFPPNAARYLEHDHRGDRQEEVYDPPEMSKFGTLPTTSSRKAPTATHLGPKHRKERDTAVTSR
jgi:hypothetical protein